MKTDDYPHLLHALCLYLVAQGVRHPLVNAVVAKDGNYERDAKEMAADAEDNESRLFFEQAEKRNRVLDLTYDREVAVLECDFWAHWDWSHEDRVIAYENFVGHGDIERFVDEVAKAWAEAVQAIKEHELKAA